MTELDLQKQIIAGLRASGFIVLSTSSAAAGRPKRFSNHSSKGIPDLLVSRKGWSHWYGLEVKLPKAPLKPEQQELVEMGLVFIVRSFEDAIAALGHPTNARNGRNGAPGEPATGVCSDAPHETPPARAPGGADV